MDRPWLLGIVLACACGLVGCRLLHPYDPIPPVESDPAIGSPDPSRLQGDAWDRRAARQIDTSRATNLTSLVTRRGTEAEVIERLRQAVPRDPSSGFVPFGIPGSPSAVLMIRRARFAYAEIADALASPDPWDRHWAVEALDALEHAKLPHVWRVYEGPERDAALVALTRVIASEQDVGLRSGAIAVAHWHLEEESEPPTEAVIDAFFRESDPDNRRYLYWLLGDRRAPADVRLRAGMHGFDDPVDVCVGIDDVIVLGNLALLEQALATGDTIGRAGLGEAIYRQEDDMPWAEDLVLRGLADPEHEVQARFAKAAIMVFPPTDRLLERLRALRTEVAYANFALGVLEKKAQGDGS